VGSVAFELLTTVILTWSRSPKPRVVGLKVTPAAEIHNYGCVGGTWEEPGALLAITEFYEKPDAEYAREHLLADGMNDGQFLTVFGQYVLQPDVFGYLRKHIENNVRERGEFQLTSALDILRQEHGFSGLMIDGKRFDIGHPDDYLETLQTFRG
jgi:UTP--glucose-1-phosphate uridylyltransferase